jgi:hypothetical protein
VTGETFPLHETPPAVLAEACRSIADFSIGFVKLQGTGDAQDAVLGGSGTLVQVGDANAILTACHVLKYLQRDEEVGLLLANTVEPLIQRLTIRREALKWITIAHGAVEQDGPDLGLLLLSQVDAAALRARKSFYGLSYRQWLLDKPPALDGGVWFLCGFADEATTERGPERGLGRVKVFEGACGAGWVGKCYQVDGFEYLDFEVRYGGVNGPPLSFGGFSGGGLWQVPVARIDGELRVKELLLSGVAFYENAPSGDVRIVKCHGRDGIYRHAMQALAG